jgi:hypothetical protein
MAKSDEERRADIAKNNEEYYSKRKKTHKRTTIDLPIEKSKALDKLARKEQERTGARYSPRKAMVEDAVISMIDERLENEK